ncbi:MAG: hypothetical protein KAG95_02815 [Bacteroidales bacterium]|nr:hypothetical protein [Bacteroidales bacterium]
MKKILVSFLLICLSANILYSQEPEWIDYNSRKQKFPQSFYFSGFSWEKVKGDKVPNEVFAKLKNQVKTQISEAMQVTVATTTILNTAEIDDKFSQSFKQSSVSFSNVNLVGLKTETYFQKRKKTAYVLAYVKKSELSKHYKQNIVKKISQITSNIESAKKYLSDNDKQKALTTLYNCSPIFRDIEQSQTFLVAISKLKAAQVDFEKTNKLKLEVNSEISKIETDKNVSLTDLCYLIASGFKMQTNEINQTIRLVPFTYQDTKMGSEFSRRLYKMLEQKLIQISAYNISTKANLPNNDNQNKNLLITGTYWENEDNLKIITILKDVVTGKTIGSVEKKLPISCLEKNSISFMPENFENAYAKMKAFSKNEVINGGLLIDVWTNKGNENLIYTEAERMKLFVRANKECYLRFIYHMADGSKVLLLDSYYIGTDKINKVIELPYEFECAAPFGVETLQLNAQTKEFAKLNTKKQYGYDFISDDMEKIIQNVRGFKRVDDKLLNAEKRIIITTMKK